MFEERIKDFVACLSIYSSKIVSCYIYKSKTEGKWWGQQVAVLIIWLPVWYRIWTAWNFMSSSTIFCFVFSWVQLHCCCTSRRWWIVRIWVFMIIRMVDKDEENQEKSNQVNKRLWLKCWEFWCCHAIVLWLTPPSLQQRSISINYSNTY